MKMVAMRFARLLSAGLLVTACFAQVSTRPQSTAAARDITLLEGRG